MSVQTAERANTQWGKLQSQPWLFFPIVPQTRLIREPFRHSAPLPLHCEVPWEGRQRWSGSAEAKTRGGVWGSGQDRSQGGERPRRARLQAVTFNTDPVGSSSQGKNQKGHRLTQLAAGSSKRVMINESLLSIRVHPHRASRVV